MLILNLETFLNDDYLDSGALNMAKSIIKKKKYKNINDNEAHMEGSTILFIKNPKLDLLPHKNLISKKVFFNLILVEEGEIDIEWESIDKLSITKKYDIIEDAVYHNGKTKKAKIKENQILIMPIGYAMKITNVKSKKYIWMDCNKYVGMKALSGTSLTI